jgi:archaellum biogenesis ATPase FlaH
MVDFERLKSLKVSQYETQLGRVKNNGLETHHIEKTVNQVSGNLDRGIKSLVIYGEPQSGKTEMMICLTAKLLDKEKKCIIVLVNDSVDLLNQNAKRFAISQISPTPTKLYELREMQAKERPDELLIFCTKNAKLLEHLINSLHGIKNRVVIDDEGDYATPNSKVNKKIPSASKINELVSKLVDFENGGTWIAVTATPARLDLNDTLSSDRKAWVYFEPHSNYTGDKIFFPPASDMNVKFHLELMSDEQDSARFILFALTRFIINVAHLNYSKSTHEQKFYSMLVHTSGIMNDHEKDAKIVRRFFSEIEMDSSSDEYKERMEAIEKEALRMYGSEAQKIIEYVYLKRKNVAIRILNSKADRDDSDNVSSATDPQQPFTVVIGGNIISRGVTFNNLLTMFFARTSKTYIQQDTYIQRARMFGTRFEYLDHMELHVPISLYIDWHRLFMFHYLAMTSIPSGNPVWLQDSRIKAVASSSIDQKIASPSSLEVSFELFSMNDNIEIDTRESKTGISMFNYIQGQLPDKYFPDFFLNFINTVQPTGKKSVVWHNSTSIVNNKSAIQETIERAKGLYGGSEIRQYPDAVHHFKIFYNADRKARVIYKYEDNKSSIKFLSVKKPEK